MSGFAGKRKKYSWLPETNPSALSGDTTSPTAATPTKGDGEITPRAAKPRQKTSSKQKADKAADKPVEQQLEGLGITTTPTSASTAAAAAVSAGSSADAGAVAATEEAAEESKQSVAGTKSRRRSRKDSVDELVRSRLQSTMTAGPDSASQAGTPLATSTGTPRGGGGGRKRMGDVPTQSTITASVRDALGYERSANVGTRASPPPPPPPPQQPQPHPQPSSSRHRSGHHGGRHAANGGAANNAGTAASRAPAPRRASPPPPSLAPRESKYSFPSYAPLKRGNPASTMKHCSRGVGWDEHRRGIQVTSGDNVIVIHPGSRWLRIGRASDPVPKEIPHVIARRLNVPPVRVPEITEAVPKDAKDAAEPMEVDEQAAKADTPQDKGGDGDKAETDDDGSDDGSDDTGHGDGVMDAVDQTLEMLRDSLKQHQRQSKRKVPMNVYSQVLTYNKQSRFETIQDHNDPFKIEWIQTSEIQGDYEIGERALRIADPGQFLVRHPLKNGCFNVEEYANTEEVLGDIESIWTSAIEKELNIRRRDLAQYGAVLVIPDIFNRTEVAVLANMLLQHIGFGHLLVHQSSVSVTFGAGISSACVIDVGAQKTSIACVEDGFCIPESRVSIMYGGDDITRFLFNMFERSKFPYAEASLQRMSDWLMLNELREKYCTMNLSDVNIRLRDFFVRQPHQQHTRKYSFKTYDEAYHAPLCLFYPAVADSLVSLPRYSESFVPLDNAELQLDNNYLMCRYVTPTQFGLLPLRVVETPAVAKVVSEQQPTGSAIPPATVPSTEPGTPDPRPQQAANNNNSSNPPPADTKAATDQPLAPEVPNNITYVPDPDAQHSRMPLDLAITHSIVRSGQLERAQKMYSSILIVGGGVTFIPEFNDVLASRLMYVRPEYMRSVERADIVSAPRELDPRVLAWKGGAVLSRSESDYNMWVSAREWADFGPRLLRDRLFFQW
ncbi:actin-like protein arp8 [Coemansia erecta]|uniref:Actin-like protein arp8 n=1 Tax=Coemansia erecta TaxID=147472 RepID=A0A9W7XXJ2_9FUNG|nr:actin-like protein arp8 [Coemansia erecta]